MKKWMPYLMVLLILTSCTNEFTKVLRSGDKSKMLDAAVNYYNEGKLNKAIELFDKITPMYAGSPQSERISYYRADANYQSKHYVVAAEEFSTFAIRYPKSSKAEEAAFKKAYCYYLVSPVYERDQQFTNNAIRYFQSYINIYSDTNPERTKEANQYIAEMREKLETKNFEIAKRYYTVYQYKAATIALNQVLSDFPDSKNREDVYYYLVKASYEYAKNAYDVVRLQRLKEARTAYRRMIKDFPDSKYLKEISKIEEDIQSEITNFAS